MVADLPLPYLKSVKLGQDNGLESRSKSGGDSGKARAAVTTQANVPLIEQLKAMRRLALQLCRSVGLLSETVVI